MSHDSGLPEQFFKQMVCHASVPLQKSVKTDLTIQNNLNVHARIFFKITATNDTKLKCKIWFY